MPKRPRKCGAVPQEDGSTVGMEIAGPCLECGRPVHSNGGAHYHEEPLGLLCGACCPVCNRGRVVTPRKPQPTPGCVLSVEEFFDGLYNDAPETAQERHLREKHATQSSLFVYHAGGLTRSQILAIHIAVQTLHVAGAELQPIDRAIAKHLAHEPRLGSKPALLGLRLIRKYETMLPDNLRRAPLGELLD